MRTKAKHLAKLVLINLLTLIFFLEIGSYGLTQLKLLPINDTPSLYRSGILSLFTTKTSSDDTDTKWWTEKSSWGAWHKPNAISRHVKSCFNVLYQSNSVGARDSEFRNLKTDNRVLLLGDSVVESIGVSENHKLDVVLERKTSTDVMNFGSAGDLGPVQYFALYKDLARRYQHKTLVILFLPSNDFLDNDYLFWKTSGKTFYAGTTSQRYRPYFQETSKTDFGSFIPQDAVPRENWRYPTKLGELGPLDSTKIRAFKFIEDSLWVSNLLKSIRLKSNVNQLWSSNYREYSGYFDAELQQQKAAVFYIESILRISKAENFLIVSVPRESDLKRINSGSKLSDQYWYQAFKQFSQHPQKRVDFIDLAEIKHPSHPITHECDGHWNENGIEWAANIIAKRLRTNRYLE